MQWLAIHLPELPLEVYSRGLEQPVPLAVSTAPGGGLRILLGNRPATAAGIRPGLLVTAARALLSDLQVVPRKVEQEQAALRQLALWAGRFTSQVSLAPPQGLLLEVGGSLRLFKGARALWRRVRRELVTLGYQACCCIAPTPRGALWLAAAGEEGEIADQTALRAALGRLPLVALPLERRALQALGDMGLDNLAGLLRLPRSGLQARLGAKTMLDIQRALGEVSDPWPMFQPPSYFSGRVELPAEVETADALLFAARRLLVELAGFLESRCAGAQRLAWRFHQAEQCYTVCELGLLRPERNPERLLELLRERLERLELPAPARAISLRVRDILPLAARPQDLFPEQTGSGDEDGRRLLERLQARLGADAVQGLQTLADYRPERATRSCPAGSGKAEGTYPHRPLWLLPEPLLLEVRQGWPYRGGRLQLDSERERIESGWWDGRDIARDYFLARSPRGERLWIFRELNGRRRWFLHGLFG